MSKSSGGSVSNSLKTASGLSTDTGVFLESDGLALNVSAAKKLKLTEDDTTVYNNFAVSAPDSDVVFAVKDGAGNAVLYVDTNGSNSDRVVVKSSGVNSQAFGVYNTNNTPAFKIGSGGNGEGQAYLADGTADEPSLTFNSEIPTGGNPNSYTGLYKSGTSELGFAADSTNTATLSATGLTLAGKCLTAAGSVSAPSIAFSGDTDTGLYNSSTNAVAVACGGNQALTIYHNGTYPSIQLASQPSVRHLTHTLHYTAIPGSSAIYVDAARVGSVVINHIRTATVGGIDWSSAASQSATAITTTADFYGTGSGDNINAYGTYAYFNNSSGVYHTGVLRAAVAGGSSITITFFSYDGAVFPSNMSLLGGDFTFDLDD